MAEPVAGPTSTKLTVSLGVTMQTILKRGPDGKYRMKTFESTPHGIIFYDEHQVTLPDLSGDGNPSIPLETTIPINDRRFVPDWAITSIKDTLLRSKIFKLDLDEYRIHRLELVPSNEAKARLEELAAGTKPSIVVSATWIYGKLLETQEHPVHGRSGLPHSSQEGDDSQASDTVAGEAGLRQCLSDIGWLGLDP